MINVNNDYINAMTHVKPADTHHHGNLKEALVAYAIRAADSGTLAELSLRKASRDLGVSPGAAYRHFPEKDALMRHVAHKGFDALADAFERALPFDSNAENGDAARDRFTALAAAYVEFGRTRTDLMRLMFGPHGRTPSAGGDRPSTYDWLAKSLAELACFELINTPDENAQFFAWSSIHGFSELQSSPAVSVQDDAMAVKRQCRFIIAALAPAG